MRTRVLGSDPLRHSVRRLASGTYMPSGGSLIVMVPSPENAASQFPAPKLVLLTRDAVPAVTSTRYSASLVLLIA